MAASKSKRSVRTTQPQAQPQQRQSQTQPHGDPHLKSQLFEALKHMNRGFGVALTAFDRLQKLDRQRMFPASCLMDYRHRTEELRSRANFELLQLFSGREEQEAEKFGRLRGTKA